MDQYQIQSRSTPLVTNNLIRDTLSLNYSGARDRVGTVTGMIFGIGTGF